MNEVARRDSSKSVYEDAVQRYLHGYVAIYVERDGRILRDARFVAEVLSTAEENGTTPSWVDEEEQRPPQNHQEGRQALGDANAGRKLSARSEGEWGDERKSAICDGP